MSEGKKVQLFREKSLEAIESPESLNDYLRVTSPGVWLVMAAIIALLAGAVMWGVFGRIDTTRQLAVSAADGRAVCYVPYEMLQEVMDGGSVSVDGTAYAFGVQEDVKVTVISEDTNAFVRVKGGLQPGDMAVEVPVEAALADGVYTGVVVTESLRPISLLLQ